MARSRITTGTSFGSEVLDAFTTAVLAEALGGVTAEAVSPLLRRATRATARRLGIRKPDFDIVYRTMLASRSDELSVLPLYNSMPDGLTLTAIKSALNSATAAGFIRQLTAFHIIGDVGSLQEQELRSASRERVYSAFTDYLAEALNVGYLPQAVEDSDENKIYLFRQDFTTFCLDAIGLLDRYSRIAAECLTRYSRDRNFPISWAQAVQAEAILESIERYAAIAAAKSVPSAAARTEWLNSYRAAFAARHRNIPLPDLDTRRLVPYEELYVEPIIATEDGDLINLDSLISHIDRAVILGDPGAGKSTMSTVIAMKYLEKGNFLPFHLTMREINLASTGFSVTAEIQERLATQYQLDSFPDLVEGLLTAGEAVLIFDGLDELLDPTVRRQAASVIELAANRYPLAPIIVTCRRIGYSQSQLNPDIFEQVEIEKFDDLRVEGYVTKWFTASEGFARNATTLTAVDQLTVEEYVTDFMESSKSIREMTANPLLLSFICILYRGRRYIPRNRPQLFEQCIDLLLRAWDVTRGVSHEVADDSYELALAEVADVITSSPEFQNGIPANTLKDVFSRHLAVDSGYPPAKARRDASLMIEHCKGRAWIFCEAGLPNDDEERYAFTHSSFLEYFHAWSLIRSIHDPKVLTERLYELLRAGRSQITVQTAVHLYNRNVKNGGSVCVRGLIEKIAQSSEAEADRNSLASLDVVLEASDAIPLNIDTVFVLCRELIRQIIEATGRPGDDIQLLFSESYRHRSVVGMVLPKVLRSLIGYGNDVAQLRLCWLFTATEGYLPMEIEGSNSSAAISRIDASHRAFDSLLKRTSKSDLGWSLALRRGMLSETEMSGISARRFLMRLFEPCNDTVARIGDDMDAIWIIRSLGSSRPSAYAIPHCRHILESFGKLLLAELDDSSLLSNLEIPQEWIDQIRSQTILLLTSGALIDALNNSRGLQSICRLGYAALNMAVLDVFIELIPANNPVLSSSNVSSSEWYEEAFQSAYQRLLIVSSDLPITFRRYLTTWTCGQIWIPEWSQAHGSQG
jgi:NACHT domain